jgi:hypothetical protein
MSKELTIKPHYDLAQPDQMKKMAVVVREYIEKNNLVAVIDGKNYAMVEGWQFGGSLMGLYPKVVKTENLSSDKEYKWKSDTEIFSVIDQKVVGFGSGLCSSLEVKRKKDGTTYKSFTNEFAVLSMSQTRSIGKAYRNLIGFVMKLAGTESTPAEEMIRVGETPKEPTQKEVFEVAKKMISESKNDKWLSETQVKIMGSKIYTEAQKKELLKIIREKLS